MQTQADIPTISKDEIYDFINKNIEDAAEKERLTEFVKLMLKDVRSSSDRKKLMSYLEEMLAGTESDPQQVYNYIQLMNKDTKLKLLSVIITAVLSAPPI